MEKNNGGLFPLNNDYASGYPANGQDLNFFNMSGNEMAFDSFSGYGSYQQPTQSQGIHGVSFRQPLGSIPVNEFAANRDTVVAQGQQLAQLQEVLDKVLTRVAVLERELDETEKAQELTQSALRRILEAEDEERKRKKQKTYQAGETKNKIQVSFLLRHERNLTAARHVPLPVPGILHFQMLPSPLPRNDGDALLRWCVRALTSRNIAQTPSAVTSCFRAHKGHPRAHAHVRDLRQHLALKKMVRDFPILYQYITPDPMY
ncbi:hypothetical protein B0H14DRAFT_2584551 [Mycena olivaceomarginata]|nr:hypothetical protein B0H14DRAFT_2584551 [Mycena olivaceomarginata]